MKKTIAEKALAKCMFRPVEKISKVMSLYEPTNDFSIPLGFKGFDSAMEGGAREGELIVISGQTGEGKTTFAQNLAVNISNASIPSLWFSYEMNPYYLGSNFKKIVKEPSLDDLLVYTPIELQERSLVFLEENIKIGVEQQAVKVVFIDHLHYLIDLKSSLNSSLLIGGIARELKQIAVKNDVVIFLIAHTRKLALGEKLNLSSIRDSSLISQEADYVFLINRKKKDDGMKFGSSGDTEWLNESSVRLAKNRKTGKLFRFDFFMNDGKLIEKVSEEFAGYDG